MIFVLFFQVNVIAIVVLVRGKCGLSKCVTHYLVAIAGADLLVIIFDLILRQVPITYREEFFFLNFIPLCKIHAVVLYAATDCQVDNVFEKAYEMLTFMSPGLEFRIREGDTGTALNTASILAH
eukprot:g30442.t1